VGVARTRAKPTVATPQKTLLFLRKPRKGRQPVAVGVARTRAKPTVNSPQKNSSLPPQAPQGATAHTLDKPHDNLSSKPFFPLSTEESTSMPSYHQLLYHIIFSTKNREPLLTDDIRERTFHYMGGIIRDLGGSSQIIGGTADHVHILFRYRPDAALSDLIRDIKANASKWIHKEFPTHPEFAWQDGYGIFTVSKSGENSVVEYIQNQAEHHKSIDSRTEMLMFLKKHKIEFDLQYFQ
jgi:putative transposase